MFFCVGFACTCFWTWRGRDATPPSSHAGLASQPLPQCGLADRALRESKPALACARLQEALKLLNDAPVKRALAVAPVGWLVQCMAIAHAVLFAWSARVAVHGRGAASLYQQPAQRTLYFTHLCCSVPSSGPIMQAVTSRQLAPRLQQDICKALADYHPDAVADYLQVGGWVVVLLLLQPPPLCCCCCCCCCET